MIVHVQVHKHRLIDDASPALGQRLLLGWWQQGWYIESSACIQAQPEARQWVNLTTSEVNGGE